MLRPCCRTILPTFLLVLLLLSACRDKSSSTPHFLDDQAGLLNEKQQERIVTYHQRLFEDLDIHLQVTILDQLTADIDALAVELFDKHRLGEKASAARGLLLLVDPLGHQVRLEVGFDLESVFTDLLISRVEREQMVPFFQANRVGAGLEATVELLVAEALVHPEGDASDVQRLEHLSGGGGAKIRVEIGSGAPQKMAVAEPAMFAPDASPRKTLLAYEQALREQVKDPDLPIYTPETREFFRQWLVTDAQQASELKSVIETLDVGEELVDDNYAVVRCPPGMRGNAPYLLQHSPYGWQLDFATMSRVIGFNHRNQWFFRDLEHSYMFAFEDWGFDSRGFPRE